MMKLQRVLVTISLVTLLLSLLLLVTCHTILYKSFSLIILCEILCDICVGLIAAALLTLATSIASFSEAKRKSTLVYLQGLRALRYNLHQMNDQNFVFDYERFNLVYTLYLEINTGRHGSYDAKAVNASFELLIEATQFDQKASVASRQLSISKSVRIIEELCYRKGYIKEHDSVDKDKHKSSFEKSTFD